MYLEHIPDRVSHTVSSQQIGFRSFLNLGQKSEKKTQVRFQQQQNVVHMKGKKEPQGSRESNWGIILYSIRILMSITVLQFVRIENSLDIRYSSTYSLLLTNGIKSNPAFTLVAPV